MLRLLVVAVLVVGCGGSEKLFRGDDVVALVSNGQPSCSQGTTGPTLTTRDAIGTRDGKEYPSTIIECDWTCGNIGAEHQAFVYVIFYTGPDGAWNVDPHADPARAKCPTD